MKPLQTVIPNLTGKWLIYGADGKVIRLSFATISLVRDEFTFAIKTSNSMKSAERISPGRKTRHGLGYDRNYLTRQQNDHLVG